MVLYQMNKNLLTIIEEFLKYFEGAEKVVGWALSHHLMSNPEAEAESTDSRVVLAMER